MAFFFTFLVLAISALLVTSYPIYSSHPYKEVRLLKRSRTPTPTNPFNACWRGIQQPSSYERTITEDEPEYESLYEESSIEDQDEDMRHCRENITGSLARLDTILTDINALLSTPSFYAESGHPLASTSDHQVSPEVKLVREVISGNEMQLPLYLDDPQSKCLKEKYENSVGDLRKLLQQAQVTRVESTLETSIPPTHLVMVKLLSRRANKAVNLLRQRYNELCQEFYGASTRQ